MTAPVPERFVQLGATQTRHAAVHSADCPLCRDDAARILAPVLANLRKQVQALRDEAAASEPAGVGANVWVDGNIHAFDAVLALLDGGEGS